MPLLPCWQFVARHPGNWPQILNPKRQALNRESRMGCSRHLSAFSSAGPNPEPDWVWQVLGRLVVIVICLPGAMHVPKPAFGFRVWGFGVGVRVWVAIYENPAPGVVGASFSSTANWWCCGEAPCAGKLTRLLVLYGGGVARNNNHRMDKIRGSP